MPDRFSLFDMGEQEQDFVMEWDEIPQAAYNQWKPPYNEKEIIKASKERIAKNAVMTEIEVNSKQLKEQSEDTEITLNYEAFKKEKEEIDARDKEFKDLLKPIEALGNKQCSSRLRRNF